MSNSPDRATQTSPSKPFPPIATRTNNLSTSSGSKPVYTSPFPSPTRYGQQQQQPIYTDEYLQTLHERPLELEEDMPWSRLWKQPEPWNDEMAEQEDWEREMGVENPGLEEVEVVAVGGAGTGIGEGVQAGLESGEEVEGAAGDLEEDAEDEEDEEEEEGEDEEGEEDEDEDKKDDDDKGNDNEERSTGGVAV